jgi:hypothetical protein
MIWFVCLPRLRSKGRRIMPSDQQLYDRGDEIRRQVDVTMRNLKFTLDECREQVFESQFRRLQELDELRDLSIDRIRASRLLIGRRCL